MNLLRAQSGFSLLEAVVAIGVLCIGIAFSADLALRGTNAVAYDQRMVQTIQIASGLMEELIVTSGTDPRLSAGPHTQYYNANGVATAGPDVYVATWTVTLDTPVPAIMQINLRVVWNGSGNAGAGFQTFRGAG